MCGIATLQWLETIPHISDTWDTEGADGVGKHHISNVVSFTVILKEGMSKGQFWAKSQTRWKSFIVTNDGPLGKLQNVTSDERNSKTSQKKSLFLDQVKTLLKGHIWAACTPLHF